eukprot:5709360-Prymnesium_polylepis.1
MVSDADLEELADAELHGEETTRQPAGQCGDCEPERVRVATIDNYQGEEADVVVISLVRSNAAGAIGFLHEPQRVNVLLSRARHGMIIIGNPETFTKSAKGAKTGVPLLEQLKRTDSLVHSLPV